MRRVTDPNRGSVLESLVTLRRYHYPRNQSAVTIDLSRTMIAEWSHDALISPLGKHPIPSKTSVVIILTNFP